MLYAYHLSGDVTLSMHEYLMIILRKHVRTGMAEPRGNWATAECNFMQIHITYLVLQRIQKDKETLPESIENLIFLLQCI